MNDNLSPELQAGLQAVKQLSDYTPVGRDCIRVALRETTASAGNRQEAPSSLPSYLLSGAIAIVLVWSVLGPTLVAVINRLADLLS